jgi:hypothetical protein
MIVDFYFLVVLPFTRLHRLAVEGYESAGSVRHLILENGSRITMDTASSSFTAEESGTVIAHDESTCCPVDANRIAFYSRTPRDLRYPLPAGWNPSDMKAWRLTLQGRVTHEVHCTDGMIIVHVDARQPVIVCADGGPV